jgi:hypothetical protein
MLKHAETGKKTKTKALVGYSGFVGSNLLQFYNFDCFYNSKNFQQASGLFFDEIYFCGVPAVKWHANKYPEEDLVLLNNIMDILKTITTNKIILISTIDVYENVNIEHDESYNCDYLSNHAYGKHRFMFEQFVQAQFINHHIIRLPALFGKGLKKNIIFDLLHNNNIHNIPLFSSFQWYDLNWLKHDIDIVLKHDIKICNLFTEPLDTIRIVNLFSYDHASYNKENRMSYNTKTQYSHLFRLMNVNNVNDVDYLHHKVNGYIRSSHDVENSIKQFIKDFHLFSAPNCAGLCVSNICVKHVSQFQFACLLKLYGISHVQIAPTTLIKDWSLLRTLDLSLFTNLGIRVYSFQSITFTLNHLNIFSETSDKLAEHLRNVIDSAALNKLSVLVFGCPRNRKIVSEDNHLGDDNDQTFIRFFRAIGD